MQAYRSANPEEDQFSFRYAMDHWTERHDRKLEQAYEAYGKGGE
jgi:hypothetical protein